jgi:hypothetical protein
LSYRRGVIAFLSLNLLGDRANTLAWSPFWFIRTMYASPDRLNWPVWELRRQTLLAGGGWKGLLRLHTTGLWDFSWINFGPFLFGLFSVLSSPAILPLIVFVAFMATMTLIYTSTAIVTIQFIYLSLIGLVILYCLFLCRLPRFWGIIVFVLTWLILSPGVDFFLQDFANNHRTGVGQPTLQLINYLKNTSTGTLITDESFWSVSLLPAYAGKTVFLGDKMIVDSLGLDFSSRAKATLHLLNCQESLPGISHAVLSLPLKYQIAKCAQPVFVNSQYMVYRFTNTP